MKKFINFLSIGILLACLAVSLDAYAQPANDECVNAIDISASFMGTCGTANLAGPFDNTGATTSANDPAEPGPSPTCPQTTDTNLFGDAATTFETSIWFSFVVPDLNGDGSPVSYSLWTSDGSYGDCGLNPNNILGGDADTQVAIYEGPNCPDASTGACDYYAANEDLFSTPPWISGWLSLAFTPGVTYYMVVDSWDAAQGEFCLAVVPCGTICGDGEAAPVEEYCDCVQDFGDEPCPASQIYGINETDAGNFISDDWSGNTWRCNSDGTVWLTIGAADDNCTDTGLDMPVDLSIGTLLGSDPDGMDTIATGYYTFIVLTQADLAVGQITITSTQPDGLGNICNEVVTLNFADLGIMCDVQCAAGDVDPAIVTQTVCEDGTIQLCTDGTEDLSLPCGSDDGSPYQYGWQVTGIVYGMEFVLTDFILQGSACETIPVSDILIDQFGYYPPNFTPGAPLPPGTFTLQGAAFCINSDGSTVLACGAPTIMTVTLDPAGTCPVDVPGCTDPCDPNYDMNATVNDPALCAGYSTDCNADCTAGPFGGTWDAATCGCINETAPVNGCTDAAACNYDAAANCDDSSCDFGNAACADPCNPVMGCTDPAACNYDAAACVDDASCLPAPTCNTDPCAGDLEIVDPNDACACIVDTPQVLGCTDAAACNYDATANCDDNSCDLGNTACADPCNEPDPDDACDITTDTFDAATCTVTNTPNCAAGETFNPANCECVTDVVDGCTDPCDPAFDPASTNDNLCVGYSTDCNADCTAGPFGGIWDAATCGCVNEIAPVNGCTDAVACNYDATANCDDNTCDLGNTACADPCNEPDPDDGCDITTDAFDAATCTVTNTPNCAAGETFNPANCECVTDPVDGCTDPCDPAYDPASTNDDLCVGYSTDCNADCTAGPFGGTWDAATCGCINETDPVSGCTDSTATNYDPAANCDDGSCTTDPGCTAEAATIAGGPFQFCAGDGMPDFVSGITVSGGVGTNTAWVVTDDQLNILGLPGMPGEVDFDGAGFGTCLIWYVTFEDLTGAEMGMNAADLMGCFALSNSIEVLREDCPPCVDEISGNIAADMGCDVSGTAVLITDAAGNPVGPGMAIADANGDYTLSGGPYACGEYIATLDVASIPACYADAGGDVGPSGFTVNGDGTADGADFSAFDEVPTLSQWGLMTLALLLMTFGALKLGFINNVQTSTNRRK